MLDRFASLRNVAPAIAAAILAAFLAAPASAQEPFGTAFAYQGELADGSIPANGSYDFEFALWDAEVGGAMVGAAATLNGVSVVDGFVSATLDFGPDRFSADARWLSIAVGPAGEAKTPLSPRRRLHSAPRAQFADSADLLDGLDAADFDQSEANELNTSLSLEGRVLRLEDAGGALQLDLSPLFDAPPSTSPTAVGAATITILGPSGGTYAFDIHDFSWGFDTVGASSAPPTGLTPRSLTFRKRPDANSPLLRRSHAGGSYIGTATFDFPNPAGAPVRATVRNSLLERIESAYNETTGEQFELFTILTTDVELLYNDPTTPISARYNFDTDQLASASPAPAAVPVASTLVVATPADLVDPAIPAGERLLALAEEQFVPISTLGLPTAGRVQAGPYSARRTWTAGTAADFYNAMSLRSYDDVEILTYRDDAFSPAGVRLHESFVAEGALVRGFTLSASDASGPVAVSEYEIAGTIRWFTHLVDANGDPLPAASAGWDVMNNMPLP
jgi:hypothetical protein